MPSCSRSTYDRLCTNIVAAARPVVDNKLLAEPLRQPLSDQARRDVGRAGRRNWHDQTHRPRWIGLRPHYARYSRERGSARGQMQKSSAGKFHFEPPSPSHHSITSSTSASTLGGISRPSALAVLRLTINSNLVDCSTGRSVGVVPRRIRSAYSAARRYMVAKFTP